MKKYSWIVALLMALSLAFVFVGCGGGGGDDPPDPNLEEVELTGEDIVIRAIGGKASDIVIDKNTFAVTDLASGSLGFAIDFPEEVKGKKYWKIGVEIELVSIVTPDFVSFNAKADTTLQTDVLIFGHTQQYHGELKIGTITDKEVSEKCDGDVCTQYTAGTCLPEATGYAEYAFNKFPNSLIAFQFNSYAGDITTAGWVNGTTPVTFKVAVTKVVFIPAEGAIPDVIVYDKAIPGVSKPVAGNTPATEVAASATQYTGAVTWAGTLAGDGTFAVGTAYTATITLTAKEGYTFKGVEEDFFTVAGATTVSNAADSGVVTAVFPAAEAPPAGSYQLGAPAALGETQKGWGFNDQDGQDLDWEELVAAQYLVMLANSDNADGATGMQFAFQGDADTFAWHLSKSKDWTSLSGAGEGMLIIVKLDTLVGYSAVIGGTKGKIVINSYGGTITDAWLYGVYDTTGTVDHSGTDADGATILVKKAE